MRLSAGPLQGQNIVAVSAYCVAITGTSPSAARDFISMYFDFNVGVAATSNMFGPLEDETGGDVGFIVRYIVHVSAKLVYDRLCTSLLFCKVVLLI